MIKAGDVVYLKSGGPSMTVEKIDWRGKATVSFWHTEKNSGYGYMNKENIYVNALTTELD